MLMFGTERVLYQTLTSPTTGGAVKIVHTAQWPHYPKKECL